MVDLVSPFSSGYASEQQRIGAQQAQGNALAQIAQRDKMSRVMTPENMAAVLGGDQNALAMLAAAAQNPEMALKLQNQVIDNQNARTTGQNLQATGQLTQAQIAEVNQNVEAAAAQMSREELEAERQDAERVVKTLLTPKIDSPEKWDAAAIQFGEPELVGQFALRDGIMQSYMTIEDVAKRRDAANAPASPLSTPGKVQADIDRGLLPGDTPLRSAGTSRTVYGPDGQVVYSEGDPAPKMTVDGAKNSGFYLRTKEANEILNSMEQQGTRFAQQQLESVPMGLGNFARDPEFQRFDQARRDFVNAILRRESGAVIADSEFENANKQYFPQPGDGPEVIAQKRRNRETAIEGIRMGAGEGAAYIDQTQNGAAALPEIAPTSIPKVFVQGVGDETVAQQVWDTLTPEEKAAFNE